MLDIYNELQAENKMPVRTDKNLKKRIIHQFLSNSSYCGRTRSGKLVKYKDRERLNYSSSTHYPAIIDPEVFDKVQLLKSARQNKAKDNTKHIYFAKKLIRYRTNDEKSEAMIARRTTVSYAAESCSASVSINLIDSILWKEARAEYTFGKNNKAEQAKRIIKRYESEISEAEKEINEQNEKQERIDVLFLHGRLSIDKYEYELKQTEAKINELKSSINEKKNNISQIEVQESATLSTFNKLDSELDDKAKQDIIREYIENVFVKKVDESVKEHMHYEIEVVTKTDLHNIYKYFPKQREILLPIDDVKAEVFAHNAASFASLPSIQEAAKALGISENKESVILRESRRIKSKDFVTIRFKR